MKEKSIILHKIRSFVISIILQMKTLFKILLTSTALLCTCVSLRAQGNNLIRENSGKQDAIYLISGDASCLDEKGEVCAVKIDFSQSRIVNFDKEFKIEEESGSLEQYNSKHGEEFVNNWPANLAMMEESVCKNLSIHFGADFRRQEEAGEAPYLMVIKIGLFDFGHFVMVGSAKSGGTITKGIVDLYDKNGKVLAEFDIHYLRGKNIGYGNNERLRKFGAPFAKELKKAL